MSIFQVIIPVLKSKKYFFIFMTVLIIMILLSYYLTVENTYKKSIIIYSSINGFWFTVISLFLSFFISVFLSLYLSLAVFRYDIIKVKKNLSNNVISGAGGLAGIAVTGCPTCGVPILGAFGYPLGLMALPFEGLEIKALSVVLLALSVIFISKNIKKSLICEIKKA